MPATDSTQDLHLLKDVDVSLTCNSSIPSLSIITVPNNSCEVVIENRAASMANNDCNKALSSPAEASPAKLASTSPATLETTGNDTSPATTRIASAADSLPYEGSNSINMTDSPSIDSPSTPFGNAGERDFPGMLTFKGVTVTLESSKVWNNFHNIGTEMILTRQGRHMFPYCRYRISGLEPERKYSMVLSIAPADGYKYRWSSTKWEVFGTADHLTQGLIRAFAHHYSPCSGKEWMNYMVSFKKLKLTNNAQDQEGNIILHSMHRYIPRLHVIPVLDGVAPTADQPVVMGPESMTFTFPQTEFMAVTTYQNFRITQMKIHYNPFAKGFRDDGHNPRLNRINREIEFVNMDTAGTSEATGRAEDQSTKGSPDDAQARQIILKPIMSSYSSNAYVQSRGKHALGNIVVVQKSAAEEPPKDKNCNINLIPPMKLCITVNTKAKFGSSLSTRRLLHKKKKRLNRQWGYAQRKDWKSAAASPTVAHSPPLTVAMQPELDDVEGLLFVSFTSKSALDSHIGDQPVRRSSSESTGPQTPELFKQTGTSESNKEKIVRLEAKLLQDLGVLKHRQAIHPVLQEVGLKLSCLDRTQPVDLQYLGVQLPLPPPKLPEEGSALAGEGGLPFISRTGKTSDMTKIKGWRNKFIKTNETLSNSDGSKNLSAFCSNMLDEYLESEAQQISERAAAFSTHPQGSVAYQLPAKSSSYVKTLDSALKQRNPPTIVPNKPCPFSNKPLLNSGRESPPTSSSPALSEESFSDQHFTPSHTPSPAPGVSQTNSHAQRLSKYLPEINNRQTATTESRPFSLTKPQMKLFEMELAAWNQGLKRTELAKDRLSVALSAVMTKWTHLNEVFKVPHFQKTARLPCGQDFCRLGCVCRSLEGHIRGPLHCRRPECMLSCTCFKQMITQQLSTEETEQNNSAYSIKTMGDVGTHSSSQAKKLWIRNICDSDREPLLIPKSTNLPLKKPHRPGIPQIREEDKSPVYKFLESKMTCARVREFNNRPPPVESLEDITKQSLNVTKPANQSTKIIPDKPNQTTKTIADRPNQTKTITDNNPSEKAYKSGTTATGKKPRTLIEIQSICQWADDRRKILEALCINMNRNKLCQPFSVGHYRVRPVAKIIMQKPTGTVTTHRVRISLRPTSSSDCDSDDNEEERQHKNSNENTAGGNNQDMKEPQFAVGVTPFLRGIQTAGVLVARTASSSGQSSGLVQVNGKSYDHARLAVGRLGSLHPANRLAAYLTGRLGGSNNRFKKISELSTFASRMAPPRPALPNKTATTERRIVTQPLVKTLLPNFQKNSTIRTIPQPPKPPSAATKPVQHNAPSPFQRSSPVCLTVSPSLKTPSFLGQRGTYSFRIRPPDNEDPALPGVQLPGGFTLIHLPTPGSNGAVNQQMNNTNMNKDFIKPGAFPQMLTNENKANQRQVESNMDSASDDSSSEYSDDYEEGDDELSVDIETVEETEQLSMISRLRRAAGMDPVSSRSTSHSTDPRTYVTQGDGTEIRDRRGEKKYSERQRRSEQRVRFDHLQSVLQPSTGNQTPRLNLLSMATDEIQNLTERSTNLEEKKRLLTQIREGYVKEIALLSGNSQESVLESVGAVRERQKPEEQMNWNSSYSDLLLSKAALVKAMKSQPQPEPSSLLKPLLSNMDTEETSQEPTEDKDTPIPQGTAAEQIRATAKNFVQQLLSKLKPIINNARSYHQAAKKLESQNPSQSLGQLSKEIEERSEAASAASAPQADNASTESTPANQPQTQLAYPLVRAKNGRIILPSSMKPIGQGFYTFTVVPSKEEGNSSSTVLLQPLDPELLKKQGVNVLKKQDLNESEGPKDSDNPMQKTKPETTSLVLKSPLANIGSLSSPPNATAPAPISEPAFSPSPQTVHLTFTPMFSPVVTQNAGHVPARRGRGRPRKHPLHHATTPPRPKLVIKEDPDYAPANRTPMEQPPDLHFTAIKRGRGRPPKTVPNILRRATIQLSPIVDINSDVKIETDTSPVTVNASRPLTRGSLGKDFPSEKKRSWRDLERELEVDD